MHTTANIKDNIRGKRIESIDLLRGIVIIIMALGSCTGLLSCW